MFKRKANESKRKGNFDMIENQDKPQVIQKIA
jgi:hypothetical protein